MGVRNKSGTEGFSCAISSSSFMVDLKTFNNNRHKKLFSCHTMWALGAPPYPPTEDKLDHLLLYLGGNQDLRKTLTCERWIRELKEPRENKRIFKHKIWVGCQASERVCMLDIQIRKGIKCELLGLRSKAPFMLDGHERPGRYVWFSASHPLQRSCLPQEKWHFLRAFILVLHSVSLREFLAYCASMKVMPRIKSENETRVASWCRITHTQVGYNLELLNGPAAC